MARKVIKGRLHLCAENRASATGQRRWPPNTLQEHRRIVARNLRPLHDVDVAKITNHILDVLYAELAARGGVCTHRRGSPPIR
jgi:hypothetical protein